MQVSVNRTNRQRQLEATARTAIEQRVKCKLTEVEWAAMRAKSALVTSTGDNSRRR